MSSGEAGPRPGGGTAAIARAWLSALGRLLLFGILFVGLVTLLSPLADVFARSFGVRGGWSLALGGSVALVAALLASILTLRWLDRRSWRALGIAPNADALRQFAVGLGFGIALIAIAVALMFASGDLVLGSDDGSALDALVMMGASLLMLAPAAAVEEALFRGYPIQVISRVAGAPLGVLTTSAAFAAVHGQNPEVGALALANIFLAGGLLGVVYMRTGSLWAATGVHLGWNWGMGGLFDLPVSGLGWIDVPGFEPWVTGPAWWNGGAFGPEGGLIGTLVFAGALFFALRTPWLRRDPAADPRSAMLCDRRWHDVAAEPVEGDMPDTVVTHPDKP